MRAARLVRASPGQAATAKTRLALQVAAELIGTTGDGVWLAELAQVTDGAQVATVVAGVLGLADQCVPTAFESVTEALADQDLLLVLDNCEHVIDAAAKFCDQVIRRCPRVRILATSREPLGIDGERVYRVPSLSLPQSDAENPEELAAGDAVRLFAERARAQNPGLILDARSAPLVASICTAGWHPARPGAVICMPRRRIARIWPILALANPLDDRRPTLVVSRHLVELQIIDGQHRISLIARDLHVSVALGQHELWLRRPVAHVVVHPETANLAQPLLRQIHRQRLPRSADEAVARERILVLVHVGIHRRTLGARVRGPQDALLRVHHLHHIVRRAQVIHMPVNRIVLFERLALGARLRVGEVNRLRRHQIPMTAEIRVRLLGGNHQEIFVGNLARASK